MADADFEDTTDVVWEDTDDAEWEPPIKLPKIIYYYQMLEAA